MTTNTETQDLKEQRELCHRLDYDFNQTKIELPEYKQWMDAKKSIEAWQEETDHPAILAVRAAIEQVELVREELDGELNESYYDGECDLDICLDDLENAMQNLICVLCPHDADGLLRVLERTAKQLPEYQTLEQALQDYADMHESYSDSLMQQQQERDEQ